MTKPAITLTALVLFSSSSWAEEIPTDPEAVEVALPPGEAVVVDQAAAPSDPPVRFPRTVIARPLTVPRGVAIIGADVGANHDFSTVGGTPIAGYGITDDLEVQVPYAFTARTLEARGSLQVDVGYKLLRGAAGGKLEAIARVRGGYSLLDEAAAPLLVGVHVQYNVTDQIAVISGVPGTQQLRISLAEDAAMATPIDVSLPIGLGVQPTPELYFQLDTKLVQIDLDDSAHAVIGRDATPVALTAVYNVIHPLDLQAVIATDVTNEPGDALTFLVGARYYAGRL
jgi:hypothetical protein